MEVCADPDTHLQKTRLSDLKHAIWQLEKKRKEEEKQQPCSRNVISKLSYAVILLHVIGAKFKHANVPSRWFFKCCRLHLLDVHWLLNDGDVHVFTKIQYWKCEQHGVVASFSLHSHKLGLSEICGLRCKKNMTMSLNIPRIIITGAFKSLSLLPSH